jgi:glycosyltransferase involved in cell wall biosynthesis
MKFTVLMPVHEAIDFDIFKKSVNSVINNTLLPSEFLIIVDGNISTEKRIFLLKLKKQYNFINIVFKNKLGLVKILNYGLKIAKYKLIARADADDINHKNRFFVQVNFFKKNKVDILGSNINENINGKKYIKKVPKNPSFLHFSFLNPINHMTVMFKRDKIKKLDASIKRDKIKTYIKNELKTLEDNLKNKIKDIQQRKDYFAPFCRLAHVNSFMPDSSHFTACRTNIPIRWSVDCRANCCYKICHEIFHLTKCYYLKK